ncbi:uncharacterized protein LOC9657636 isoform X1 [Selaginella moellendorffii]|uniref:uncharacterized protein LOC9657636 isoform X1 n=1 Tax=Selaginella moellendorffii TaxID=88036 RepID=UPI000D1CD55D|nr:uncharacterized protein LOC9657636 isoform X1 [Selaginella moellendorffii]|eukprot:XP_024541718.1 uncharacterized protein LOC9657636 isoform X1 [Selaginella moellendorffii]
MARKIINASDIASNAMQDENIFKLCNPFVQVKEGKITKFEDGKLTKFDKQVSSYLLEEVILEMQKFGECYARRPNLTEVQYRPVACAMFPVFAGLAPKKGELLDGEDMKNMKKDAVSSFDMSSITDALEEVPDPSRPGSRASNSSRESDRSGFSFTGDTFIHEDGTHLKGREAVDVRGLVTYDNNQVAGRSIFEMKGNQKWTFGLYQGLNYGVGSLVDNIKRHRFKKFYVVVMGIEWVGCAVIDPIGFLISKEKKLSGIPEFRKHVELKIAYLKQKGKTEEFNQRNEWQHECSSSQCIKGSKKN